jgi:hypothetical protein
LLVNYGFCFQGNEYESFSFDVRLDLNFSKSKPITIADMLAKTHNMKNVQVIRLKDKQFNETLMAYLRTSLKEDYFEHKQGKSSNHIFVTEPVDLDFELHCLSFYHAIIEKLSVDAEKLSTLETDLDML